MIGMMVMGCIRVYHNIQFEYDVSKAHLKMELDDYNDLLDKLKKLSPKQMDKLTSDFEEWVNKNN